MLNKINEKYEKWNDWWDDRFLYDGLGKAFIGGCLRGFIEYGIILLIFYGFVALVKEAIIFKK